MKSEEFQMNTLSPISTIEDVPPDYFGKKANYQKNDRKIKLISAHQLLYFIIFLLTVFSTALCCLGVYVIHDHAIFSEALLSATYAYGVYVATLVAGVLLVNILVGIRGVMKEEKFHLWVFSVVLIILFIILLVAIVLIIIFPFNNGNSVRESLIKGIKEQYGNSRHFTDAMSYAQTKLRCCAADNRGWQIYLDSVWYRKRNFLADSGKNVASFHPASKLVPESCCWTLLDPLTMWPNETNYRDVDRCQHWQFGPPLHESGAHNDAIYYRGCFSTMRDYLIYHMSFLLGTGITLLIVMVVGIVLSCLFMSRIQKRQKIH